MGGMGGKQRGLIGRHAGLDKLRSRADRVGLVLSIYMPARLPACAVASHSRQASFAGRWTLIGRVWLTLGRLTLSPSLQGLH